LEKNQFTPVTRNNKSPTNTSTTTLSPNRFAELDNENEDMQSDDGSAGSMSSFSLNSNNADENKTPRSKTHSSTYSNNLTPSINTTNND